MRGAEMNKNFLKCGGEGWMGGEGGEVDGNVSEGRLRRFVKNFRRHEKGEG